jgi:hypothetical protein
MPDGLTLPQEVDRFPAFIDAFAESAESVDAAHEPSAKEDALARFRALNKTSRSTLKSQRRQANSFLRKIAERDLTAVGLESLALLAFRERQVEQNQMIPRLTKLQAGLIAREKFWDAEALECLRDSIEIVSNWLTLHQELTDKVLNFVSDRLGTATKRFRAHPVKSDIDHRKLSREFMARYPRIRAALAK